MKFIEYIDRNRGNGLTIWNIRIMKSLEILIYKINK